MIKNQRLVGSLPTIYLQQFAFKPATNKNIKPIAGLRPATPLVSGLLEHGCRNKNQITCAHKTQELLFEGICTHYCRTNALGIALISL